MPNTRTEEEFVCCVKWRTIVTTISIINIVTYFLVLIWHSLVLVTGVPSAIRLVHVFEVVLKHNVSGVSNATTEIGGDDFGQSSAIRYFRLSITIVVMICVLIYLVASLLLLIGARKRDVAKCETWISVTIVLTGLYVVSKVFIIIGCIYYEGLNTNWILEGIFWIALAVTIQTFQVQGVKMFKWEISVPKNDNPPSYNALTPSTK